MKSLKRMLGYLLNVGARAALSPPAFFAFSVLVILE